MALCWICDRCFDGLSKEHIIPRLFEGYVTTEEFSCAGCNGELGKIEQRLAPISILMQNLDNADGEPTNVVPKGDSPKKDRKWSYGEKPGIELSTDGSVRAEGWERPPGKITSEDKLWHRGHLPMEISAQNVHRSMLKAIMALACHVGFPRQIFEASLAYLAGTDDALPLMEPTSLGIPTRGMFARVWLFAPPSKESMTVYGAVAYGPLINIYRLCTGLQPAWPFCCELRAYSREILLHDETTNYMNWRSNLLEELIPQYGFTYIGLAGPYAIKESRQTGLVVCETSPSAIALTASGTSGLYAPPHPLMQTHGPNRRFENWVRSVRSEEEHAKFLVGARDIDGWIDGPQPV